MSESIRWEVSGWAKHAEEDSHEDGCLPDTGTAFGGPDRFTGKTLKELVDQLWGFVPFRRDDDAIEFDSCEDEGRIDIQGMEDIDGNEPSDLDMQRWRQGELKLWAVTYTFMVELVTRTTKALTELPGTCPTCTSTLTPPTEDNRGGSYPPNYCLECDRQIEETEVTRPWQ